MNSRRPQSKRGPTMIDNLLHTSVQIIPGHGMLRSLNTLEAELRSDEILRIYPKPVIHVRPRLVPEPVDRHEASIRFRRAVLVPPDLSKHARLGLNGCSARSKPCAGPEVEVKRVAGSMSDLGQSHVRWQGSDLHGAAVGVGGREEVCDVHFRHGVFPLVSLSIIHHPQRPP